MLIIVLPSCSVISADCDEAMARFHRLDNSGQEGHGLGLSIVSRIAKRHGATVKLTRSATLGGLEVETTFPVV